MIWLVLWLWGVWGCQEYCLNSCVQSFTQQKCLELCSCTEGSRTVHFSEQNENLSLLLVDSGHSQLIETYLGCEFGCRDSCLESSSLTVALNCIENCGCMSTVAQENIQYSHTYKEGLHLKEETPQEVPTGDCASSCSQICLDNECIQNCFDSFCSSPSAWSSLFSVLVNSIALFSVCLFLFLLIRRKLRARRKQKILENPMDQYYRI